MFVLFARAESFGNFSCWFYVGIPLLPKLSVRSVSNLGLSLHVLITSTPTFVMFARAMSFFNAALKTQEKFGLQSRSVPVYKKQGQTFIFFNSPVD